MTTESVIASYVDAHHAEQIDFLRQIVRVPSDTPPGNNNPPAEKAAALLRAKGYVVERFAVPDDRVRDYGMVSVTNLIVRHTFGSGGPTIALNAHGDVVPPGDGWSFDPYGGEVKDGRMYGRGVAVSKSDIASFTFALDDPAWQARILERGVAVRSRLFALPYGDQGLLLTRALYRSAGGFHSLPLMEDVDLLRRLPHPVVLAPVARTSAGRWRSDGWWARSARNLTLLALWRAGVSEARLATLYDRSHRAAPSPPPTAPPGA